MLVQDYVNGWHASLHVDYINRELHLHKTVTANTQLRNFARKLTSRICAVSIAFVRIGNFFRNSGEISAINLSEWACFWNLNLILSF